MTFLTQLRASTDRSKKRLGQGYGSGKGGHTTNRGQKGQTSRNSLPIWFEGGQLPQIRRFPFVRGKNRFDRLILKPVEINLTALNRLVKDTEVTPKTLVAAGLVQAAEIKYRPVKILGRGKLDHALIVKVPVSAPAKVKIEAAGGKVVL